MNGNIPGYVDKVHVSLTRPIMIGGVPPMLATMLGAIGFACAVLGHYLLGPGICLSIYFLAAFFFRKDDQFIQVLFRNFRFKTFYRG